MTRIERAATIRIDIYIAGDPATAKDVCREYCFDVGLCVHIEQVDYIYTGGAEPGVKVGLINYPRFPMDVDKLLGLAETLGARLMERMFQHSFSIVAPGETIWFSRRAAAPPRRLGRPRSWRLRKSSTRSTR